MTSGQAHSGHDGAGHAEVAHNVSDLIVDVLADAGIRRIFGVTGDALNAFVEAIRQDGRIEWVSVRHEETAAFAAYAEAELTGGIGACAGTVGPGALHLLNGLYNAKREGAGVIAITGQVARELKGRSYFQEVDLFKVFDDVCGLQEAIEDPSQLPLTVEIAVRRALWGREVVRLELPVDVSTLRAPERQPKQPLTRRAIRRPPLPDALEAAAEIMNGSEKVAILAGAGCRDDAEAVLLLAQRLAAPITHTLKAKDIFDTRSPHVVGLSGLLGTPAGYRALRECEALLMLGTDFPYEDFYPADARVVQVDIRAEHIGRRVPVEVGLVADVGGTVERLMDHVFEKEPARWLRRLQGLRDRWLRHTERQSSADGAREPLDPRIVTRAVSERASDDAIFTMDTGCCAIWIAHHADLSGGRRLLGSFNHGSMGSAMPVALGAAATEPGREVWAFVGDGGFTMSSQDLTSFHQHGLPVRVVVFDNSQLAFVKMEMEAAGLPYNPQSIDLDNPDFVALARASGWEGGRIETADDIGPVLDEAVASSAPFLIDAAVSPGVLTLPPHLKLEQAWGFGMSKLREAEIMLRDGDREQWRNWERELEAAL